MLAHCVSGTTGTGRDISRGVSRDGTGHPPFKRVSVLSRLSFRKTFRGRWECCKRWEG
jgi:hypothetical protein